MSTTIGQSSTAPVARLCAAEEISNKLSAVGEYSSVKKVDQALIKKVREAMRGVKKGNPLKDYLDKDEIEDALNSFVTLDKTSCLLTEELERLKKERNSLLDYIEELTSL